MTDGRCLDYDPETEGSGLDRRPVYDIDGRVQEEGLCSYLCVYDTATGAQVYEKTVPKCWITHVQFDPADPEIIMYNHEWPSFDCGIRRIWIYDHRRDEIRRVRKDVVSLDLEGRLARFSLVVSPTHRNLPVTGLAAAARLVERLDSFGLGGRADEAVTEPSRNLRRVLARRPLDHAWPAPWGRP
jgi:hypothetical protein